MLTSRPDFLTGRLAKVTIMDFKEFLKYGTSAAALLAASASGAEALTITQSINVNSYLTQGGGTLTGQFDITGLLAPPASFNQPYDVVSATITAYGYSAPNATQLVGGYGSYYQTGTTSHIVYYSYSYGCGWSTCYGYGSYYVTDYIYQHDRTQTNLDNVADTLQLTAGGDNFSGAASSHDTSFLYSNTFYEGSNYNGSSYSYFYSYTAIVNDILDGNLSAGGSLSAGALGDLAQDGKLPFSVDAALGQFTLYGLQLTVTLNENPAQGDIGVPEPVPAGPIGAGMLLLMLYRRLARRRAPRA